MSIILDTELCVGCGCCGEVCSQGALELPDKALLLYELCIDCGACVEMCPVGALTRTAT